MGILISIVLGLCLDRIFGSKLFQGKYSLKQTFWGFGVAGALLAFIAASAYVGFQASNDHSSGGGWTIMAVRAVGAPLSVFAFVVFVGIWRSARHSRFFIKLLIRYISLFYLSTSLALALFFSWFGLLIALGVLFLKRQLLRARAASTNIDADGTAAQ